MLIHGRHEHQVTLSLRVSDVRESLLGHFGCRFHRIIACVWSKKKICVNCASGRTDHLMDMRERFLVLNEFRFDWLKYWFCTIDRLYQLPMRCLRTGTNLVAFDWHISIVLRKTVNVRNAIVPFTFRKCVG